MDREKTAPLIRQTESAECGLACLVMMACWHGLQTDLPTLRERFSISTQGMTLQRLIECAAGIRLSSRAVRLEPEDLKSLSLPCILHWNMNHFVVLYKVRGSRLVIHDPDKGKITLSLQDAGKHFTGVALELTPASDFTARDERKNSPAPTDRQDTRAAGRDVAHHHFCPGAGNPDAE